MLRICGQYNRKTDQHCVLPCLRTAPQIFEIARLASSSVESRSPRESWASYQEASLLFRLLFLDSRCSIRIRLLLKEFEMTTREEMTTRKTITAALFPPRGSRPSPPKSVWKCWTRMFSGDKVTGGTSFIAAMPQQSMS